MTALVSAADKSAVKLINLLVTHFPSTFRDVFPSPFDNDDEDNGGGGGGSGALGDERKCGQRELYFLKRAQILVADLWACFDGKSYGEFSDIQKVTMFAGIYIPSPSPTISSCHLLFGGNRQYLLSGDIMATPPLLAFRISDAFLKSLIDAHETCCGDDASSAARTSSRVILMTR